MVIATGHVSVEAAFTLLAKARQKGIWRFVATHPLGMDQDEYSLWKSSARSPVKALSSSIAFYGNARFQT